MDARTELNVCPHDAETMAKAAPNTCQIDDKPVREWQQDDHQMHQIGNKSNALSISLSLVPQTQLPAEPRTQNRQIPAPHRKPRTRASNPNGHRWSFPETLQTPLDMFSQAYRYPQVATMRLKGNGDAVWHALRVPHPSRNGLGAVHNNDCNAGKTVATSCPRPSSKSKDVKRPNRLQGPLIKQFMAHQSCLQHGHLT